MLPSTREAASRIGQRRGGPFGLGELPAHRLDAGDGIQLRLQFGLLARLPGLEEGEAYEDRGDEDEADNGILVHYASPSSA